MSTEWRHRPSLQALISRKQRMRIIAKSRLMTIAILGAIFGQTKFLYIDYTYAKIQLFSTFPQLAVFRFLSWLYFVSSVGCILSHKDTSDMLYGVCFTCLD